MNPSSRIYIAGHNGFVGSALYRKLRKQNFSNLITRDHSKLDLTRQSEVEAFFEDTRPEYVFIAAAKVGGILANNTYPAEFIYNNLLIQTHIIDAAWKNKVRRLLFLGSSCIYPRECPQPIKEEYLLSGFLEPTNEPYAIAKIAGIKMCQSYNRQYGARYIAAMPTNIYGPNDNFDLEASHVIPALIRKYHEAKANMRKGSKNDTVTIWGTGAPLREFLHVDDLADACMYIMNLEENVYSRFVGKEKTPLINIGYGKDISIKNVALMIKEIVGFEGESTFDTTKPDGIPRKLLDVSVLNSLGWSPQISLKDGIRDTYEWYLTSSAC